MCVQYHVVPVNVYNVLGGAQLIHHVTDADLERVRAFLEAHAETSLFLLSNLALLGPRLGDHPNSGNYQLLEERGRVAAVFCLTRGGNLLVQAAGRAELAWPILKACEAQPIAVRGVIGEWPTANALWRLLCADPRFQPLHSVKDVLYRLSLSAARLDRDAGRELHARALDAQDFDQWEPLNTAYLAELDLPAQAAHAQRKAAFVSGARARLWWGVFEGSRLAAIAGLNATYGSFGQVGGVYTGPKDRRKGLARAAMSRLIEDCTEHHRFARLILFTGEDNHAARRLYESLGFEARGAFGLLLGERRGAAG